MEFEISLDKRFNFIHRCDVVIFQITLDIFINNFFFLVQNACATATSSILFRCLIFDENSIREFE